MMGGQWGHAGVCAGRDYYRLESRAAVTSSLRPAQDQAHQHALTGWQSPQVGVLRLRPETPATHPFLAQ